jgi:hypothetical protein
MNAALRDLVQEVESVEPPLVDSWEATALLESLGYTDRLSREAFGFSDTRALAEHVYAVLAPEADRRKAPTPTVDTGWWRRAARECSVFAKTFFSSYVYAVPWVVLVILQYTRPNALRMPPDLAGLLSLGLMASLITSGGFIEVIARRGQFYIGLKLPALADNAARQFVQAGCIATLLLAMSALMLGLYVDVFPSPYLLIAVVYYVMLCLLWMMCKVLTLDNTVWRVALVLAAAVLTYVCLAGFGAPAVVGQLAAPSGALLVAVVVGWRRIVHPAESIPDRMRARWGVVLHSLAPVFWHGAAYFGFLFADRIMAGLAVPAASGIYFGVDVEFQRGSDLALLSFFTTAALIEYLSHQYMRYWRAQAAIVPEERSAELRHRLWRRYLMCTMLVVVTFMLCDLLAWRVFTAIDPEMLTGPVQRSLLVASVGYFVFSLGVFDAVLLFSANRARFATRPLLEGLLVNIVLGGTASNLVGPPYAGIGLVAGAIVFVWRSRRAVIHMLREPDHAFYTA